MYVYIMLGVFVHCIYLILINTVSYFKRFMLIDFNVYIFFHSQNGFVFYSILSSIFLIDICMPFLCTYASYIPQAILFVNFFLLLYNNDTCLMLFFVGFYFVIKIIYETRNFL